jgi:large subunit ribosomal protein L29
MKQDKLLQLLIGKSSSEINTMKYELLTEYFNLRMQKGSGQEIKPHLIRAVKKNIARIKTVMNKNLVKSMV